MQISRSPVPAAALSANTAVVTSLKTAHDFAAKALQQTESGASAGKIAKSATAALQAATDAFDGARALGSNNMLEGTAHRYATHAVRQLVSAAQVVEGGGKLSADSRVVLQHHLFDAEVSTRLGHAAGERSLASPHARSDERSSGSGGGTGAGSPSGSTWVDGQQLDGLGNPTRGSDVWAGPDGQRFDGSGNAVDDSGSYTGPDGETYSGI